MTTQELAAIVLDRLDALQALIEAALQANAAPEESNLDGGRQWQVR